MPQGRWSRAKLYDVLADHMQHLNDSLGGLPSPTESEYVWQDIWHEEAHHSTALEGNTLVLREVSQLLEHGKAVGSKTLREYTEVQGYGDAASWVYKQAATAGSQSAGRPLISLTEVRHIHELIMTKVWAVDPHRDAGPDEGPGSFRRHEINAFAAGMKPVDWVLVPSEMDTWICETNGLPQSSDTPIPERIARIHNSFERIHPFLDGNGRTGRLCMNLVLVRLGYPPVIILKKNREKYLAAMQKADGGDYGPLGEQIARAMLDNLDRFIVPGVAGPARMVPLASLADDDLSKTALRAAATRGRLRAEQRANGVWHSTRKAVDQYKASRHRQTSRTDP